MGRVTGIHNPFLSQIAEQAYQPFDYIRAPVLGLAVDEAAELGDGNGDFSMRRHVRNLCKSAIGGPSTG